MRPRRRLRSLLAAVAAVIALAAGVATSGTGEFVLRGNAATESGGGLTLVSAGGSPAPTSGPSVFFDFRSAT